jgi:mannose-1-phosphate guanylyltransferase
VSSFVEKPDPETAQELFGGNAVWNTMVLAARAAVLFQLFERHVPALAAVFAEALTRPAVERQAFLRERYRDLAPVDFSRDVLGRAGGLLVHTWPASMGWSDLGTPERLEEWRGQRVPFAHAATLQPCAQTPPTTQPAVA